MHESLICRFQPVASIPIGDFRGMFEIFSRYYANAPLETFLADMNRKTGVFVVRRADGLIVGFSTVQEIPMVINGERAIGVFSGDTIVEREYWGGRALQLAFARYVFGLRLRHPLMPLYWCLISKGYKTFLTLANNYPRYFPHPEGENPELAGVVHQYCEQLFPGYLDRQRMLLDFGENAQRLRGDAAPITESARRNYPKIAFFEQRNPTWQHGTELPCVGMLGWKDFWLFARQTLVTKMLRKRRVPHPDTLLIRTDQPVADGN